MTYNEVGAIPYQPPDISLVPYSNIPHHISQPQEVLNTSALALSFAFQDTLV
jgi:hypothetical protein